MEEFTIITSEEAHEAEMQARQQLLKEVAELKALVLQLTSVVGQQSALLQEQMERFHTATEKMQRDIQDMQTQIGGRGVWYYFSSYVLPILGSLGVQAPMALLFGLRAGLTSTTVSYLLYKMRRFTG